MCAAGSADIKVLPLIEFAHFNLVYLLIGPVVIYLLPVVYLSRRVALRVPFIGNLAKASGEKTTRKQAYSKASRWQILVACLVWALVVAALMKPVYIGQPITKTISQRDLIIAVDLSDSMKTRDMLDGHGNKISRIEAVKEVLQKFLRDRKGEKIALIVFGSSAFLQAPFTDDLDTLEAMLDQMQVSMAGPQTAIGDAISLGVKLLNKVKTRDRLIILLTDGTDTSSKIPPKKAAILASENKIEIITIAFGSEQYRGKYPIDTTTLRFIAKHTHGRYFYARDKQSLTGITDEINKLKPREVKKFSYRPTRDLFIYPAALALLILVLQSILLLLRQRSAPGSFS